MVRIPNESDSSSLEPLLRDIAEVFGKPFAQERVREAFEPDAPARSVFAAALERLGLAARSHETSSRLLIETAPSGSWFAHLGDAQRPPLLLEVRARRVRVHHAAAPDVAAPRRSWLDAEGLARLLGAPDADAAVQLQALDDRAWFEAPGDEDDAHASPLAVLGELIAYERDDIVVVAIYAIAVGVFGLVTPLTVQALVSTVAFGTLIQPIVVLGLMVLGFLLTSSVLRTLQAWVVEVLQRRLFVRTAASLADRLPRLDLGASEETRHAERLVPRFLEVANAQKAGAALLLDGLEAALTALVGLVVLAFYHPMLLTFDLLLLVALAGVIFLLGRSGVPTSIEESTAKYDLVGWLQTVASRPHSVRGHGGPEFAVSRADTALRTWLGARDRHFRIVQRQRIGALAVQAAASAGLLVVGGYLVVDAKLTLGQLVAAELIVSAVAASITKLAKHAESFYDLVTALGKLAHLDHLTLERGHGDRRGLGSGPASLQVRGDTSHEGLGVVDVHAGEHLLVRDTDDGAFTRALLFACGLEQLEGAVARLDGVDVTTLDPRRLRERVALVREPEIWPATVLDNVRFGRPDVKVKDVHAALERIGALDRVLSAPGGFARPLMHADALDAADAVAIAIARAIVSPPGLLLLDGTLDRLAPEEAAPLLDALSAPDVPWTLVVRSRMELVLPRHASRIDARASRAPEPRKESP